MPPKFIRKRNRLPFKELYQVGHWYFITICTQDKKCIFVEESPSFPEYASTEKSPSFPQDTPTSPLNPTFVLNQNGQIIEQEWLANLNFYESIILDKFVIMPNHFHAIIGFDGAPVSKSTQKPTDLSKIISAFKSSSYRKIKSLYSNNDKKEHIYEKQEVLENGKLDGLENGKQDGLENGKLDGLENGKLDGLENGKLGLSSTVKYLIQEYNTIWQKSFYDHIIRNERDLFRIQEYIFFNPLKWHLDSLNPDSEEDNDSHIFKNPDS